MFLILCAAAVKHLMPSKADCNLGLLISILTLAGDVYLGLAHLNHNLDIYRDDFECQTTEDEQISNALEQEAADFGETLFSHWIKALQIVILWATLFDKHYVLDKLHSYADTVSVLFFSKNLGMNGSSLDLLI